MSQADLSRINRCETQLRDFLIEFERQASSDALFQAPAPGKWSAREHLAHLARYHEIFMERLERIVSEPAPTLARYKAEDDPAWPAWTQLSTKEILSRLDSLRPRLIRRLRALHDRDFQKTGIHPRLGEMTLSVWLEFFLVHEGHHLYTVLLLAGPPKTA